MRNTIISILLFIILVGFLWIFDNKFTTICIDITESCIEIEDLLDINAKDDAYEKSVELLELIKNKGDIPAIYLNHVDYDLLMNEALKLCLYIKGNDKAESLATLHALRYAAEHLKDLQKPNFNNIL